MTRAEYIEYLRAQYLYAVDMRNDARSEPASPAANDRAQYYNGKCEGLYFALQLVNCLASDAPPRTVKPVMVVPADEGPWPF